MSKYANRISDVDCGNFLKEINSEFDSRKDATHAVLLFTGVVMFPDAIAFTTGLFATVGGTVDITLVWD